LRSHFAWEMTILYSDSLFLRHETGRGHPERSDRLRAIAAMLDQTGLRSLCSVGAFQPVDEALLGQVHAHSQIEFVRQRVKSGGGRLEADTVVSPDSDEVARAAVGAGVAAVDAVLAGRDRNALCLVRPPGHHATADHSMGFCLYNNIALAARHALSAYQLNRVLIVDWDVHHGNGTQDIFYEDPQVTFFSIHRYGGGFYPGTGAADETGRGRGLGHIINAPVRYGTSRKDYHAQFRSALEKAAEKNKPELVLISAGFDAHRLDPVGCLGLEVEDFTVLSREVLQVVETHAHGRVVSLLEGGYHLQALTDGVHVHLKELLSASANSGHG
jgi:acetoin utilization deacetylase AcuC-like enzyme